jgi:hypothetical protein
MGRKAELLDAFVFGKFQLGDKPATVRLGRHTLLWGESLFFGANGIAGGMAPLDLPKLLSVPNSQFKEIARPTGKLSGQMQLSDGFTLGAYVAYEWEKTRLMPVGAYLSSSDSLGPGAERINAGPTGTFAYAGDVDARDSGQGGVQLRWHVDALDTDFGLYAIRYHATGPSNIWTTLAGAPPALSASSFRWAYHEGIRAFGASFAKTIDEWSLAGEASYRQNTPLASSGQSVIPAIGLGAVYLGSWNANLSYVHFLGKEAPTLYNANNAQFQQALKDRNCMLRWSKSRRTRPSTRKRWSSSLQIQSSRRVDPTSTRRCSPTTR